MSVDTIDSLRIPRLIQADRQAVWNAWTQPEQMKQWSCPQPGGVQEVTSDFRVGGSFTIKMRVEGKEYTAFGTYREIDEPSRVVYTWDWKEEEHRVGETLVTVKFEASGGATEIVLLHDGFPAAAAKEGHAQGWGACLSHLEAFFA